jgi:hypothetical protein
MEVAGEHVAKLARAAGDDDTKPAWERHSEKT